MAQITSTYTVTHYSVFLGHENRPLISTRRRSRESVYVVIYIYPNICIIQFSTFGFVFRLLILNVLVTDTIRALLHSRKNPIIFQIFFVCLGVQIRTGSVGAFGEVTYRGYHIETATISIRLRFVLEIVYDVVLVTSASRLSWKHFFSLFL